MKYYFKEFIKENYREKPSSYLFILWSTFKNLKSDGRLSNYIKNELTDFELESIASMTKKGTSIISKLEVHKEENSLKQYPHLDSIQIKNFRGFGMLDAQDAGCFIPLDRYKNIFFGPNGSGKTSFCEAFEYKITSSIKESKRRNIPLREYTRRGDTTPDINILFNSIDFDISKMNGYDKEFFHMCFIEKNRLQEFALLGSKDTGVKGTDIIANLLGLHELDNLVSSFVKPNSFKLNDYIQNDISNRVKKLESENQGNLTIRKESEEQKEKEIEHITNKYKEINGTKKVERIKVFLASKEEELKGIKKLKESLEQKVLININRSELISSISEIENSIRTYYELQEKLTIQATELNYEKFYNAINEIRTDVDCCPACDTPLENVITNPFEKAENELVKLKGISEMKKQMDSNIKIIESRYFNFSRELFISLKQNMTSFEQLKHPRIVEVIERLEASDGNMKRLKLVEYFVEEFTGLNEELLWYFGEQESLFSQLQESEKVIINLGERIKALEENVEELRFSLKQIASFEDRLVVINKTLVDFENAKDMLKIAKDKEDTFNDFITEVENSYEDFYKDLIQFKLNLENKQILNIEEKILDYYDLINRYDDKSEKVKKIHFKLEQDNYRIYITKDIDDIEIDAHSYLSEGHLRALGLSLMLAVAEKNSVPFIVFDDVVNAIDSDHRANIIDMMFNDPFLRNTQQIITTHDRLFWERYCNSFTSINGKKHTSNISSIFKSTSTGTIIKQYNVDFESKIRSALNNYDIRQALVYCRIWFESIATGYCTDRNMEMKARFTHDKTSNRLKASLESIYRLISEEFNGNENLSIIKNDLINWTGQNQEHHAFDENSYNFVHSKNSDEVLKTFIAIKRFVNDVNKDESIIRLERELKAVAISLESSNTLIQDEKFIENAPEHIVEGVRQKNRDLLSAEDDVRKELDRLKLLPVTG